VDGVVAATVWVSTAAGVDRAAPEADQEAAKTVAVAEVAAVVVAMGRGTVVVGEEESEVAATLEAVVMAQEALAWATCIANRSNG
jgi:hypothetical protein